MQKFWILFLALLSVTLSNELSKNGRDFITGLMKAVKGKDYKLDDKCLGPDFDKDYDQLMPGIEKENIILVAAICGKILTEAKEKCPFGDLVKMVTDLELSLNKPEMVNTIMSKSKEIIHTLKEEIDTKPINAKNLGETVGKVLKMLVYDVPHKQEKVIIFLGEEQEETVQHKFSEESMEDFVNGFFEGVSSVPYAQNKCAKDISSVKTEIVLAFTDLISAIRSKKDVVKALMEFYGLTIQLKGLDSNCRFSLLSQDIASLSTKVGMAKLFMRLSVHIYSVLEYMKGTVTFFEVKDFRQSGLNFGELTKLSFNYSTI